MSESLPKLISEEEAIERAEALVGEHYVEALIIKSAVNISFKIVETSERLGLSSIRDIRVIE